VPGVEHRQPLVRTLAQVRAPVTRRRHRCRYPCLLLLATCCLEQVQASCPSWAAAASCLRSAAAALSAQASPLQPVTALVLVPVQALVPVPALPLLGRGKAHSATLAVPVWLAVPATQVALPPSLPRWLPPQVLVLAQVPATARGQQWKLPTAAW